MKCKVCGAYNEDYLEYCEKCAAPLTADEEPAAAQNADQEQANGQDYQSYVASTGETPPAWGFVKAPNWPKPDFDANTVSEDDIPEGYTPRFNPRPANAVQHRVPAAAANDDSAFTNNVRPHAVEKTDRQRTAVQPSRHKAVSVKPAAPIAAASYGYSADESVSPVRTSKSKPVKISKPSDDDFDDYSYDDYDDDKPIARSRKKRTSSGSKKNLAFVAAAVVLVALIVVLGFVYVKKVHGGDFSKFISCTFGGDPITRTPTIESTTTSEGAPAYLINVYAKRNYTVRYSNGDIQLERTINKNQHYIPFVVPQSILVPDEPLDVSQYTVKPDFFTVISPSGKETKLEIDQEIVIDVPSIELNVTEPSVANFTVESPVVPIAGSVSDNTVGVFVGDNQIAIDESGNFSTTYTLPAEGVNTIVIEARKNGYKTASVTFNATYGGAGSTGNSNTSNPDGQPSNTQPPAGNVTFSVNSDVKRIGTASTMSVSGTMESGASISVSGVELEGAVTQDSNAGTFSFTVKTAKVGVYEAVITATKGDAARTSTVYLEHQPDKDAYIKGVHKMNYEKIKQYPTHEQGYKIVGKVTEVIQSTPYVKARIQTSDGDMIFYYYSGVAAIEVGDGKTYELYGDPYGTDDASGLPQLHAWFVLKRAS